MVRRGAGSIFFLLLAGLPAGLARSDGTPGADVLGPPMTALDAGALRPSDLVVVGHLARLHGERSPQVAEIQVEEVVRGPKLDRVMVLVGGPHPTNDEQHPSAPYFDTRSSRRVALFLGRSGDGVAWRLLTLFDVAGDVGQEKLEMLRRHVELAAIVSPDERARATRDELVSRLLGGGVWTRVHAARELVYLAGVRPDVFDAAVTARLESVADRVRTPAEKTWLMRLLGIVTKGRAPTRVDRDATATPPDALARAVTAAPDDDARVAVLERALESGGRRALPAIFHALPETRPAVRRRVFDLLAEGGWREALPLVRDAYAQEDETEVLAAIVRAVGRLGGPPEVPWLVARLESLSVRREALFSLARIRTPEALEALRRFRVRTQVEASGDTDVTALVDYLLSPAFEAVDRGTAAFPGR